MTLKKFIIDEQLAQAIGNYLVHRPFIEVEQLINGLRALRPEPKLNENEDEVQSGK